MPLQVVFFIKRNPEGSFCSYQPTFLFFHCSFTALFEVIGGDSVDKQDKPCTTIIPHQFI
jgi:hypothetical protein